jgi:Fanconi-associated nuclease 1
MSEVNARSNEISNGDAEAILTRVWEEHSEKRTCVVGLDWTYELADLQEICRAFPPSALSTVMKVFAQEYGQRGGGVPDLFLWKTGQEDEQLDGKPGPAKNGAKAGGQVMFAEVKSENDRLSDTQRMWIDVLSGAGVAVELCHAVAEEVRTQG